MSTITLAQSNVLHITKDTKPQKKNGKIIDSFMKRIQMIEICKLLWLQHEQRKYALYIKKGKEM